MDCSALQAPCRGCVTFRAVRTNKRATARTTAHSMLQKVYSDSTRICMHPYICLLYTSPSPRD
eukprot:6754242-Alexandrium_andersonii.AAC.1